MPGKISQEIAYRQAVAQITTRIVFVGSSNNLSNARTREEVHAGLDFHNN